MGSIVSKLRGPARADMPPFIGLAPDAGHPPYGSPGLPGFLGVAHAAFRPSGPSRQDMVLNGISTDRLGDRRQLLAGFDNLRRHTTLGPHQARLVDIRKRGVREIVGVTPWRFDRLLWIEPEVDEVEEDLERTLRDVIAAIPP